MTKFEGLEFEANFCLLKSSNCMVVSVTLYLMLLGPDWGMDGYMMMVRNKGNMCGIASDANYPY